MKTYQHIDEYRMVVKTDGKDVRDSIGATVRYAVATNDVTMMEGPLNCVEVHQDGSISIYRHPSFIGTEYNDFSRDHLVNLLWGMKYFGMEEDLKFITGKLKWRISDKFTLTPDLWLYTRAVVGKTWARVLFYIVMAVWLSGCSVWNWFLTRYGRFTPERSERVYSNNYPIETTSLQISLRKKFYPAFALSWTLLSIWVMPKTIGRWLCLRIIRLMVGKKNLTLRCLLGQKVTQDEVDSYPPMRGGRFSTYLNERNNRWCIMLKTEMYDDRFFLDKKFLETIYNITH